MKIDVDPLQYLMGGSHLGKDNTHTNICCSNNIDYRIENVMHKCLDLVSTTSPLIGNSGSSTCSFQILTNIKI